jgi:hypothetical protein
MDLPFGFYLASVRLLGVMFLQTEGTCDVMVRAKIEGRNLRKSSRPHFFFGFANSKE